MGSSISQAYKFVQALHTAPADLRGGQQSESQQHEDKGGKGLPKLPPLACGKVCLPVAATFWCHLCCVDNKPACQLATCVPICSCCSSLRHLSWLRPLRTYMRALMPATALASLQVLPRLIIYDCDWTAFMCLFHQNSCMAPFLGPPGGTQSSVIPHSCLKRNVMVYKQL